MELSDSVQFLGGFVVRDLKFCGKRGVLNSPGVD